MEAMHGLEADLAEAAPRREGRWRSAAGDALRDLDAATTEEQANAGRLVVSPCRAP